MSYTTTLGCGCTVYVARHPRTGVEHTRIIERRGPRCGDRHHEIGWRLGPRELDDAGHSAPASPPAAATACHPAPHAAERVFADAVRRAMGEYLEMPGLQLTEAQAARLWCLEADICGRVLAALVDAHFLVRTRKAAFLRP